MEQYEPEPRGGGWKKAARASPTIAAAARVSHRAVLLIDSPGSVQTYFWIGNVGVDRHYPERAALDLVNTRIGLIISYTAFFLPFCVYLMTAFYSGLPRELVEAARMDGAKLIQIWWHVMLPLGKPALITLGILNTLYCWNDVLISLLVLQKQRTLMVGIAALKGEYTTNVPLLMAGIVIAAAPIVIIYIVFQRRIVNGRQPRRVRLLRVLVRLREVWPVRQEVLVVLGRPATRIHR